MNQQFKKIFSVALALLLGLGIVFIAWKSAVSPNNKVSFESTIKGDSWKDSLLTIPQSHSSKILSTTEQGVAPEATTTTAIVARELLANYALMQQGMATTTLSDADAQALAQILVDKIQLPKGVPYTTKNLNLSSDNSEQAFTVYAKKVGDIVQAFSSAHKINELVIVADALSTKDASKLQGLKAIAGQYAGLQKSLLAVSTPSVIAPLHLRLVQSYANIEAMITTMQKMISDPVLGLTALTQYKKEFIALDALAVEYRDYTPTR